MQREQLLEAIQLLAKAEHCEEYLNAMEQVAQLRTRYPVRLTGAMYPLNSLIELQESDPTIAANTRAYIDRLRQSNGLPPCWPAPEPESFTDRKVSYQRQLMAKIRERTRRALDIENAQRNDRDKLRGVPRLEFERKTQAKWGERREAILNSIRQEHGGRAPRELLEAARDKFWDTVDNELSELEHQLREELHKPHGQRRKIAVW